MFGFLKEKLKSAISSFSKKAEEEAEVIEPPKKEKKPSDKKPSDKRESKAPKTAEKKKEKLFKPGKKDKKPAKKEAKSSIKEAKQGKKQKKKQEAEPIPEKDEEPEAASPLPEEESPEDAADEEEIAQDEKEESPEEKKEEAPEEEKGFFRRLKDRFAKKEEPEKEPKEKPQKESQPAKKDEEQNLQEPAEDAADEEEIEPQDEKEESPEEKKEEASEEEKGFFGRLKDAVTTKVLSDKQFDEMFFDLEVALLENNVAMEVVEKIKGDMKSSLVSKRIERGKFEQAVGSTLVSSIGSLFDVEKIDLEASMKSKKPYVIVFVGVNGSGKTTTISKVAKLMQNKGLKPVIAAADTFRAAAIHQLEEHGSRLGVKVIKHDYGSDPAAVAFDAIKYACSKGLDAVLIDTAGRQHSNINLMDEMKKIIRVTKPDLKVFIGESITGNDCIEQAKKFDEAIGIDAIVLTKADVDEKGGAAVSVSYVTGKPIIFIGMGQGYDDLKEFDKEIIMENLGLG